MKKTIKKILIAALVGGFFSSAHSQQLPEDVYPLEVDMQLACVNSFSRIIEILEEVYSEIPMVISHLSPSETFVLFVNETMTTSTLVVTKRFKDREESCVLWGGQSNGTSFSINPDPAFPVKTGVKS